MRRADPAIVHVPGLGLFSFGANKRTARLAGEFYVNAINVMRGAEARSISASAHEFGGTDSATLPEHVAAAIFALTVGGIIQTTGLHIPVHAGVATAFLR